MVGGGFLAYNGTGSSHLCRLNADGTLDASFALAGAGITARALAVVPQADGKILVAGEFIAYNGSTQNRICRLNTDGTLDATFAPSGTGLDNAVYCIALQLDGKLLAGGIFVNYNGVAQNNIARLFATTPLVPTTTRLAPAAGPVGATVTITGMYLADATSVTINGTSASIVSKAKTQLVVTVGAGSSSGAVVVTTAGGTANNLSFGVIQCPMPANTAGGTLDVCFTQTGRGLNSVVFTVAMQPDGKVLVGGDFTAYNGTTQNRICRLNADGTLDAGFAPTGAGLNSYVTALALQPDGKVLVAGDFTSYDGTPRNYICRLNADGTLDASFAPTGTGLNSYVNTLALQPDGKVLVGGIFNAYNGTTQNAICRLNADGTLDASFAPTGSGLDRYVSSLALQPDGKVLVGGEFTAYNGTPLNRICRLNADGTLDATFASAGTGLNSTLKALALQPDGKILVGGDFTSYNGTTRNKICRLNADGAFDATFAPSGSGLNDLVNTLAVQPDGKVLVAGAFTFYNGTSRNRICRLNHDGTIDATFTQTGTGLSSNVYTLALQPDRKVLVGGNFDAYHDTQKSNLLRLFGGISGPTTTSLDPIGGPVGTTVTITGTSLANATSVTIGGTSANIVSNTSTQVVVTVGTGSSSGAVAVTTAGGTASNLSFAVCSAPAQPTITAGGPTTFCGGGSVTLTAPDGFAYLWSTGETTQSINATATGNFSVQTISGVCSSAVSAPVVVTVQAGNPPSITPTGPITLCQGQTVRLTASVSTGILWSVNNAPYKTITLNSAGSYTVRQIVGTCTTAASVPVVVSIVSSTAPRITASGPTTLCGGSTVTLTSSSTANNVWSTGETTQAITASTTGNYSVQVVAAGCSSSISAPLAVSVTASPAPPTISPAGPIVLCPGQNVRLTSSAPYGNIWSVANLPYRTLTLNAAGSYSVRQIVGTCTTAASVPVQISLVKTCGGLAEAELTAVNIVTEQGLSIRLYPNPVNNGSLTVESSADMMSIRLLDLTGTEVHAQHAHGLIAELQLNLPKGAYVAVISSAKGTVRKLVVWE